MNAKQWTLGVTALMAIGTVVTACNLVDPPTEVGQGIVIQNVTVVNTRDGTTKPHMTLLVNNGKIQKIVPFGSVKAVGTAQAVDAEGKYVVPGFLDMHAHALDWEESWPLLVANGVTGFRQMNGSAALIQRGRQLNADSAAGKIVAPEVLQTPGEIFVGQSPTAAGAAAFVQQQKASSADFMKVTGGSREAILSVLAESKNQGLYVAGHETAGVGALESSNLGWHSFEHLGAGVGHLLDCAGDEAAIRQGLASSGFKPPFPPTYTVDPRAYDAPLNAPFYQRILDTYSQDKCGTLTQTFIRNGTWEVPTLIRLRTQNYGNAEVYRTDPNLKYVDKTTRAIWEQVAQDYTKNLPASAIATLHQYYSQQQKVTRMMKRAGVKMLAGSDMAKIAIWVIPGFSLHQEFHELAASGLSPLEVLQMTTLNGAEFLGREATLGTVDEGKEADLVLLDANPMADVTNLDKIAGVFLNGNYFSRSALDKLKADVATTYANQPAQNMQEVLDSLPTDHAD